MIMKKNVLISAITALLVSAAVFGALHFFFTPSKIVRIEHVDGTPAVQALYTKNANGEFVPLDFTATAEKVTNAVVNIRSSQKVLASERNSRINPFGNLPDPFRQFFEPFNQPQPNPRQGDPYMHMGTGSGVIINEAGYIVTNNHVVADADEVEVTLHDNRSYKATVVGTDPSTDLALIKIDASGLPKLSLVNSDNVKVGEWVLAVGNPFNLTSTVTAGIVSAKGRNINILQDQYAIESFIQTDAAINPGNSGGALVNLEGGLIGINTAIASPTGAYSGYGFAVPANIVSKVVEDLLQFGTVQRGYLGILIRNVDGNLAKDKKLSVNIGVYVDSLMESSAAAKAGVKAGDVITKVENTPVRSASELQEQISRYHPGDQVQLTVNRNGSEKVFNVTLNNAQGETKLAAKGNTQLSQLLGADLAALDAKTAKELGIDSGVKVQKLYAGRLRQKTQMKEGFIITKVDGKAVKTPEDVSKLLNGKKGGVMLEGIYENNPDEVFYYAFGLDA